MSGTDYNFLSQDTVRPISQTISQWQGVQKNALDIQQTQAKQAAGQILQQSTDANGNTDYNQAAALAARAGPGVSFAMQDLLTKSAALRGANLTQGITRNSAVNNAIIGALNGDDAGLHDRVVGGLQGLVTNGVLTQDQATREALSLPNDAPSLRQRLQQYQTSLAPADLQQQQISGRIGTQTGPGGVTIGTRQDINTGAVSSPPQQGAPQGLSPEAAAERTRWLQSPRDYPDPANPTVTKHGTNETFLRDSGVPNQYIYTGGAPATPGTQPQQSPLGTGRLPPALTNPNRPQATPAAPPATPSPSAAPAPAQTPASSPAGTAISGPTPAQKATAAATEEQGKLGPQRFQQEADADTQAQSQQAILGNMLSDTSQFTTGPLAGIVGKVRNLAGNLGLNINTEAQSAKESFNKLAAGLANAQGAGSDARMAVNISANPHEELSPAGVDLILRQLQGNADYIRARASLAAKYPNKADYPGFQDSISGLDPRVFQMARMTADQRANYWKSLDSEARKQIDAAGKKATELGVLGG